MSYVSAFQGIFGSKVVILSFIFFRKIFFKWNLAGVIKGKKKKALLHVGFLWKILTLFLIDQEGLGTLQSRALLLTVHSSVSFLGCCFSTRYLNTGQPQGSSWVLFFIYFCSLGELIQSQGFNIDVLRTPEFLSSPDHCPELLICISSCPLASPFECLIGNSDSVYIKHNHSFLWPSQICSFSNLYHPNKWHHHPYSCWNPKPRSHSFF